MLYTAMLVIVAAGLALIFGYLVFQGCKIIVEEMRQRTLMQSRQNFYRYFRFIPSSGQPTRDHQARVKLALRALADEVHQHHRRWITDSEVMAADGIGWLHEQHFNLAEKEFNKALSLAHTFGLVKPCYTSYHHFLDPQMQEETRLLEISLQPLRNLN